MRKCLRCGTDIEEGHIDPEYKLTWCCLACKMQLLTKNDGDARFAELAARSYKSNQVGRKGEV